MVLQPKPDEYYANEGNKAHQLSSQHLVGYLDHLKYRSTLQNLLWCNQGVLGQVCHF